jgi:hypothetical protein
VVVQPLLGGMYHDHQPAEDPASEGGVPRYHLISYHPRLIAVTATLVRVCRLPGSAVCRLVPDTATQHRCLTPLAPMSRA